MGRGGDKRLALGKKRWGEGERNEKERETERLHLGARDEERKREKRTERQIEKRERYYPAVAVPAGEWE